jgi:GTP cyclohydrolase I
LRGIKHDGCIMKTSKLSGDFMVDRGTRQEFYEFIR